MKIVKLYEFGGPEVLQIEETKKPVPKENEVVIKVENIALNYSEIQQRKGTYPFPLQLPNTIGQWGVVSGKVIEVGNGVTAISKQAKVMAQIPNGSYAEYVAVPEGLLVPLPDQIDIMIATTLLTQGQSAYHALKTVGNMKKGEIVLIHAGSGGLGNLAIQMAKAFGAKKIIATASSQEKIDYALSIGANVGINYSETGWPEEVLKATNGNGVDLILESVGGDVLEGSIKVLSQFGRLLYIGSSSAKEQAWDRLNLVNILSNKTIIGFNIAHLLSNRPELVREGLEYMFGLMMNNLLKPHIKHVFPFSEVIKAHELIESRKTIGTVILKP